MIDVQKISLPENQLPNTKSNMDTKFILLPVDYDRLNNCLDPYQNDDQPRNESRYSNGRVNGKRKPSELCWKLLSPSLHHDPNCSDEFDPYVIVILSQL